jgi:hypothetical protein
MSFGGPKVKPAYSGIQIQSSSSALPVPLHWGMARGSPNLLDYQDFRAIKHKEKQGKGFGTTTTTYTYSATVLLALCEGEIAGVARAWKDQGTDADYSSFGFTLFTGTTPQTPWGYMTTAHPSHALGYPGTAYLAGANYDLGASATLPAHSFEIQGLLYNSQVGGEGDADPALVVQDFLTTSQYGALFPAVYLDTAQLLSTPAATTTGDATYQTYCRAMGFGISPALTEQEEAQETLSRWALVTNTAPVWTGYSLALIPHGDEELTGNGVKFVPNTGICYALTDDDYGQNADADPVEVTISDPADVKNTVKLEICDRANAYNPVPVTWQDQVSIEAIGRREEGSIEAHDVCNLAMAGKMVALIGARMVNIRSQYRFTLSNRFILLLPMDVITLTDSGLGLVDFPVRVVAVEEIEDGTLQIDAEEFPAGVGHTTGNVTPGATPTPINSMASPGPINPPIIFEPPATLSGTPQVWAAISGGDGTTAAPYWGGCIVWASTDGATYHQIGEVDAPARMGVTTGTLASYGGANPDTTHSVGVNLLRSAGELEGASSVDAANGLTLAYLGGELLSYRDATLTGTNAYTLGGELYRGLYGTTASSHGSASAFARLDDYIFKYDLPADYIGSVLYFKFQSFNIWGLGTQDLAACVAYAYTPTGAGFGGGANGVPSAPTGLGAAAGATEVVVSWTPNSLADNVNGYTVWRAAGTGAVFAASIAIATVGATTWADVTVAPSTGYTYFVTAENVVGTSAASSGVNATTSASGGSTPYGFSFDRELTTIPTDLVVRRFTTKEPWTIPTSLTGSVVKITGTAPSAQTDFDLQVAGVSAGTIRFAASATTATFIKAAPSSVAALGVTTIVAPASLNGMTGTIYGEIGGTR